MLFELNDFGNFSLKFLIDKGISIGGIDNALPPTEDLIPKKIYDIKSNDVKSQNKSKK